MTSKMKKQVPLGYHDFEDIINRNLFYVDKSLLIKEILEVDKQVYLFPRPRRFGKTLNMMMLRRFFEKTEVSKAHLFEGLNIFKEEKYKDLQGTFPVIWLSFKDIKSREWQTAYEKIQDLVSTEYGRHAYLFKSEKLSDEDKIYFKKIYAKHASRGDLELSVIKLSYFLEIHHQKKSYLLIDEYDTPINESCIHGYYDDAIDFLRNMYSFALKDNPSLERAVVTGIYRVAKESIFSGLNNLIVSTMLDTNFADKFGFTETEVEQMIAYYGLEYKLDEIKNWYDGYVFGGHTIIYNPWSILYYIYNPKHELKPYWANTSSNDIIKELIVNSKPDVKQDIETLIQGGTIEKRLYEDVVYGNLNQSVDAIWNFFLFSGYLKVIEQKMEGSKLTGVFAIPNIEIQSIFKDAVLFWFVQSETIDKLDKILSNLKKNNLKDFSKYFADFIRQTCSYYDFADKDPERVYHALVLGMMVNMQSDYRITSNRESGYGRYDIVLHPLKENLPAYIFEFKKFDQDDESVIEETLSSAMQQIKAKEYTTTLQHEGFTNIHLIAIAFKGKDVKILYEEVG